jgi:protein-tyrosine phosphatase
VKILFVCMGNICRSPTAEAVFRKHLEDAGLESQVEIDSAGTGDWHVGKPPDERARQAGAGRGYDLENLRARQVSPSDFQRFDLILAMDHDNLQGLQALRGSESGAELDPLLGRYSLAQGVVPDPYYGEEVLDLIEQASVRLLDEIRARL